MLFKSQYLIYSLSMDEDNLERRLAEEAVKVFADEWVKTLSPRVDGILQNSRQLHDMTRVFHRSLNRLVSLYTHPITVVQVFTAVATLIRAGPRSQYVPLSTLFTHFMEDVSAPGSYGSFDIRRWVERHEAG